MRGASAEESAERLSAGKTRVGCAGFSAEWALESSFWPSVPNTLLQTVTLVEKELDPVWVDLLFIRFLF